MTPTDDLIEGLASMLAELEGYLLSPELFWPIDSPGRLQPRDRLTIGNLLLHLDQIKATQSGWDLRTEARFRKTLVQWEQAREKWKSAISIKADQEVGSRINLWRSYLVDLDEGQGGRFDYAREVRNRVIIERLADLEVRLAAWDKAIDATDQRLSSLVVASNFIWPESLKPLYPSDRFWFLYRTPRTSDTS